MNRPGRILVCLLMLTAAGLALRCAQIDAFGLSPDDGNYLHSAGVTRMPSEAELSWVDQDLAWLKRGKTYPHSYIHQYVIRLLKRTGADNVAAVRLGSALLGALTPWILYLLFAGRDQKRKRVGLLAAAMLTGYIMHAWYSRTGWGQPGCTFFFMVYLLFADRLFHDAEGRSGPRTTLTALGMVLASLLAYGYHEMIVVHVAGMGLYSLLFLYWNRGTPGGSVRLKTLLAFGLACVPVTAWAATLLGDSFATQHWTGTVQEGVGRGYFEYRFWILNKVFYKNYGLHEQVGLIVVALAICGMFFMKRRDKEFFRYIFTMFMTSWAILFFGFRDPYLVRIYLPTFILLIAFAAEGALGLADRVRSERRFLAHAGIGTLLALLWSQSYATLFIESDTPVTVASFYTPRKVAHRHPLKPISDYLLEHRKPGEILGVSDDRAPYFALQDAGIPSRPYGGRAWNKPIEEQATWIVRGQKLMKKSRKTLETGGLYELVATDTPGRIGLYRMRRPSAARE